MIDMSSSVLEEFIRVRKALNLNACQKLRCMGVGIKQAQMIRTIAENPGCSHADLARATDTDPAAAGRALNMLVRGGWVTRNEHPGDRRRWTLALTPAGRRRVAELKRVHAKVERELAAPLGRDERDQFLKILTRVAENLEKRRPLA